MTESAQHELPLTALHLRPNPRGRTDPKSEALAELVASVRALGILQPVLVRPRNGGGYEVVAGARRVAAARIAGLESIPAHVRELDDLQAREAQLVENLRRLDLHPLEEAEGYEQLLEHGVTVDELAEKVGKSRSYVYARTRLLALGKKARKLAFEDEEPPSTSVVLLAARIPGEAQQVAFLEQVGAATKWNGPMAFREARDLAQREFMLQLSAAPFDPADAELVPKAGACGPCPKRTGNAPDLFGDVGENADVCTDPACHAGKVEAHGQRALRAHERAGGAVMGKKKLKELFQNGQLRTWGAGAEWLEANAACTSLGASKRTLAKALGEALPPITLALDERGVIHRLVTRKAAAAAARRAGVLRSEPRRKKTKTKAEERRDVALKRQREESKQRELRAVAERDLCLAEARRRSAAAEPAPDLLPALISHLLSSAGWEAKRVLADDLGLRAGRGRRANSPGVLIRTWWEALAPAKRQHELTRLVVTLLVADEDILVPEDRMVPHVALALGVDLARAATEAEAATSPAPDGEKKAAAKKAARRGRARS